MARCSCRRQRDQPEPSAIILQQRNLRILNTENSGRSRSGFVIAKGNDSTTGIIDEEGVSGKDRIVDRTPTDHGC